MLGVMLAAGSSCLPASEPLGAYAAGGDEDKGHRLACHLRRTGRRCARGLAGRVGSCRRGQLMTSDKARKKAVRARMAATGEPYSARRRELGGRPRKGSGS